MDSQEPAGIGEAAEPAWLALQSIRWEPAGRSLLAELGDGAGFKVVDIGCGDLGWLRILSDWVGPEGSVTGTDLSDALIEAACGRLESEGISNVVVVKDDLFRTHLPSRGFDLVHARFAVTPLDKAARQIETYVSLVRPAGWIVLEDNDVGSWHYNPPAPAAERLIHLIAESFLAVGESLNEGRHQFHRLRALGLQPRLAAQILALKPGDPYLRLPVHFSFTLEPRLLKLVTASELQSLRRHAEEELASPDRWATTFTLIQTWARVP
jgi:SAM-dependent methyltransferase